MVVLADAQDQFHCSFYLKTGSCRFGAACGKGHPLPQVAATILFKNMYVGVGMSELHEQDAADDMQVSARLSLAQRDMPMFLGCVCVPLPCVLCACDVWARASAFAPFHAHSLRFSDRACSTKRARYRITSRNSFTTRCPSLNASAPCST